MRRQGVSIQVATRLSPHLCPPAPCFCSFQAYVFAAPEVKQKVNAELASWWPSASAAHSPVLLAWAAVLCLIRKSGAGWCGNGACTVVAASNAALQNMLSKCSAAFGQQGGRGLLSTHLLAQPCFRRRAAWRDRGVGAARQGGA